MTDQTTQPLLEDEDGAPYPEDVQAIVRECVDLRAEVERLRELADQWERVGGFLPASQMKRLRAILGAPKDTTAP